ncbi:hypothetical protein [Polyangium fumosum]|uniref:Uncharacterized protein n=1 Tax=Polyangium fumosum TaxID=889272 RepID=A0A4U1JBV5_9BACT|nr:hypothetical protein [Polyangium fumosum]TKD05105.1 hypothetical protein E8A74_21400 [Polyangium fumosum]
MQLDADQQGATGGHISGVISAQDFSDEVANMVAPFDESFCNPNSPTLQSILKQIRMAADIMSDGTQDPTKQCDAISIGVGFTMKSAQLGPVAPAVPPPPDPCAPSAR